MNQSNLSRLLGIRYPILLGGMARISDPILTAAVSEAGGLGTLAAAMETQKSLVQQIRQTRKLTPQPFAVNIPVLIKSPATIVDTVINAGIKVVVTSAGDPRILSARLKAAGILIIHVVSSPEHASRAESAGVDAVIAEGFESGGKASVAEIGTLALIPQVVDAVKIPVIAAGGICDARGYLAARILGAEGVSLGTIFLASKECRKIGAGYREQLISAGVTDTAIAARDVFAIRLLKNNSFHKLETMISKKTALETIRNFIFSSDLMDPEGLISCGQGVGQIREIKTVREIIDDMVTGAEKILNQFTK
jgi:enoyl-[acyl-carrier protein] reductase II